MSIVTTAAVFERGFVISILSNDLKSEIMDTNGIKLIKTPCVHIRKKPMIETADAFLTLLE